jgi:hypothetical protein
MLPTRASGGCGDEGDGRPWGGGSRKGRMQVIVGFMGKDREIKCLTQKNLNYVHSPASREKERCELTGS